jgi:hypothetical protein
MKPMVLAFFTVLSVASAQKVDLGAMAGIGGYSVGWERGDRFAVVGVESCFLCAGKVGAFVDYGHWEGVTQGAGHISRLDLFSGGLRLQSGKKVRPFFDIGVTGGIERYPQWIVTRTHGLAGAVLGGGASILLGEHWYIRPQVRLHVMRDLGASAIAAAASASVGFGYRF